MGLKEFKEKLSSDEEFAKKYENVATPEELIEMAAKDGYTFTLEDVKNDTELTDKDLESAAGGYSVTIMAKNGYPTDRMTGATVKTKTTFVSH